MRAFVRELAWDLRGNRVNVGLSFVALLVAMLSFVLISVLSRMGTDALVAQSEEVNGRPVTLSASLPADGWSPQRVDGLNAALKTWNTHGATGALVLDKSVTVSQGPLDVHPCTLRLTSANYRSIRRISLADGRWFDGRTFPGEVAVNAAAATMLGAGRQKVTLDLGYSPLMPLTVVGTVADGNPQPVVYADARGFQESTPLGMRPDQAAILAHTTDQGSPRTTAMIHAALATVGMDHDVEVARADQSAQIRDSLAVLSAVFLGVAVIGLVVAVLGMVNVGLASIRERARDLTIRRALGATRSRIIAGVACGTVVVGFAATSVALALSYAATTVVLPAVVDANTGVSVPAYPWPVAGAAAAGGLVASLLSGLAPALGTRSLDLAALLRE